MAAQLRHREEIVRTAALLFRRQGYAATGTNQIVAVSGAPKGSLYHYFSQDKEQIAQTAVEHAVEIVRTTLARLLDRQPTPGRCLACLRRAAGGLAAGVRPPGRLPHRSEILARVKSRAHRLLNCITGRPVILSQ